MSDRKSEIIKELESHIKEVEGLHYTKIAAVNDLVNSAYRANRELDSPRIIRTVQELEALDPDCWLVRFGGDPYEPVVMIHGYWMDDYEIDPDDIFPLVVMMDGAQVRAAREAMEKEHG